MNNNIDLLIEACNLIFKKRDDFISIEYDVPNWMNINDNVDIEYFLYNFEKDPMKYALNGIDVHIINMSRFVDNTMGCSSILHRFGLFIDPKLMFDIINGLIPSNLSSNDFNDIFKCLSSVYHTLTESCSEFDDYIIGSSLIKNKKEIINQVVSLKQKYCSMNEKLMNINPELYYMAVIENITLHSSKRWGVRDFMVYSYLYN